MTQATSSVVRDARMLRIPSADLVRGDVLVLAEGDAVAADITGHVRAPADVVRVLLLGVSLAVAAVPEGLPAILSVVLALGGAAHGPTS